MLTERAARWLPFLSRYAETAPACCNACRTCTTTNALNLVTLVGVMAAAPFVKTIRQVRGRVV